MKEKDFFETLRTKLEDGQPSHDFDRRFWKRFRSEFSGTKSGWRLDWRLVLAPAGTALILVLALLGRNQVAPPVPGLPSGTEVAGYEMLQNLDLLMQAHSAQDLSDIAEMSDQDWKKFMEGHG